MSCCDTADSLAYLRTELEASCSGRDADDWQTRSSNGLCSQAEFGSYKILRELNRGATAVVYEAMHCPEGSKPWESMYRVALKVIGSASDGTLIVPRNIIQREISCSARLKHRNVAELLDVVASNKGLALALELVNGPDLLDYVKTCGRRTPEDVAVFYFRQLLDAVAHMHANGIAHRDLKPENCMVDLTTHTLKVIDFGLAAPVEDRMSLGCGTIYTIAPECIAHSGNTCSPDGGAVDLWGLGVTLYIMVCGRFPFQDIRRPHDDQKTIRNTLQGNMNLIPDHVSPQARHLILSLMRTNPAERPSLEEISNHPFVTRRVRTQQVHTFEAKMFAGSFGLPSLSPELSLMSYSQESVFRNDEFSHNSSSFLMDRFLRGSSSPQPSILERLSSEVSSPATISQPRRSGSSARKEDAKSPPLQAEVVRAALQGAAAAAATSPPEAADCKASPQQYTPVEREERPRPIFEFDHPFDCFDSPDDYAPKAQKLFTLSADSRALTDDGRLIVGNARRSGRLVTVPEVSETLETEFNEQADLTTFRTCSVVSNVSARSDSTMFAVFRNALQSDRGMEWYPLSASNSLRSSLASASFTSLDMQSLEQYSRQVRAGPEKRRSQTLPQAIQRSAFNSGSLMNDSWQPHE